MKFEQIFSLRCQTEQAQSLKLGANSFSNDFLGDHLYSTPERNPADCAKMRQSCGLRIGGAGRDRTDDILLAKQALSQLSYGP